jgi:outer membrane receptor protein involved in Fe transport
LYLEPLWQNSLSAQAGFRLPWGQINQSLSLDLRHLPHQRYIREPYSELINSRTQFSGRYQSLTASMSLDQRYSRKDHLGGYLPESIDISLEAGWQVCRNLRIRAELTNLLGSKYIQWRGLPQTGRELRLGASYTWR